MARVVGPFDDTQIARDTTRVIHHYDLVLGQPPVRCLPARLAEVRAARDEVQRFAAGIVSRPDALAAYTRALNDLDVPPLWWSSVAHPALRHLWMQ
jgi:hypothetical protein